MAIRPGRRAERGAAWLIAAVVCTGCAARGTPPADGPRTSAETARVTALAEADRLAATGCYTSMRAALDRYTPHVDDDRVRRRAFEVAVAVALRERRLGLYPGVGSDAVSRLSTRFDDPHAAAVDVVDLVPWRRGTRPPVGPTGESFAEVRRRASRLHDVLLPRAGSDAMAALLLMHLLASHPLASLPPEAPLAGRRFEPPSVETWPWVVPHLARPALALVWLDVRGSTTPDEWAVWQFEHPGCDEAFVFLADAELAQRRLASTDSALGAAVAALPDLVPARVLRGDIRLELGDYAEALEQFTAVTTRMPEHSDALLGEVQAFSHLGRSSEAIAAADRLLTLSEWHLGDAYYWKAWNLFQQGALADARASLTEARRLLHNASVYYLGALIAYRDEQWQEAREDLVRAREAEPGHCDARFLLGAVHLLERGWAPAVDRFAEAEQCFVRQEPLLAAALADVETSAFDEARRTVLRARRRGALDACVRQQRWARYNRAAALINLGKGEEGRALAEALGREDGPPADAARDLLRQLEGPRVPPPGP